jgi:hypothetical protein
VLEPEVPPSYDGDTDGSPYPRGGDKELKNQDPLEATADTQEGEVRSKREEEGRRGGRNGEPDGPESIERFASEDLEKIGRDVLGLIRRYTEQSKTPRREPEAHKEKEED